MGGISDFANNGYCAGTHLRDLPTSPFTADDGTGSFLDYTDDILKRLIDVEPDIYAYSFPGHNGKFVFDQQGVAHSIPYESLKIEFSGRGDVVQNGSFVITDESGNAFTFSVIETSETTDLTVGCGSPDGLSHTLDGPTGYFLTQIITPTRDTVLFSYQTVEERYTNARDLTEYAVAYTDGQGSCNPIMPPHNCITQTIHTTQVLKRIVHRGETIEFTYDTSRQDLLGGVILQGIRVQYAGVTQKEFVLYHSYFGTFAASNNYANYSLTPPDLLRLRLDSVRQVGMPAHRFSYNLPAAQGFPAVHSYAQDLWGYYNGKDSNPTLVQRPNNLGAIRDSDSTAVKLGMLQKITYPTGGTATFTYEANMIYREGQTLDELEDISGLFVRSPNASTTNYANASFTITGVPRRISIIYNFPNSSTELSGGLASIVLSNAVGKSLYEARQGATTNVTAPFVITLQPGTYYLAGDATGGRTVEGDDAEYWAQILVQANKVIPPGTQPIAGCRIRQITTDGQTTYHTLGTTYYRYTDSLGVAQQLPAEYPCANVLVCKHLIWSLTGTGPR